MNIFYLLFFSLFSIQVFALSLEDIYSDLKMHYPQYQGITYDEPSSQNSLIEDDWLLQTPNMWDSNLAVYNESFEARNGQLLDKDFFVPTCQTQDDCSGIATCKLINFTNVPKKLCVTKAYDFLETTYNSLVNAHDSVDIATLALPPSDKRAFTLMFKNALFKLATKSKEENKKIVVRFLQGSFASVGLENAKSFLNDLVSFLPSGNKLVISISDMRSCDLFSNCKKSEEEKDLLYLFSWNHGKIINIDNHVLIVGGENFSSKDYLRFNPVNDSNIKIEGSVSKGATTYANVLWGYVNSNRGLFSNTCVTYENGKTTSRCVIDIHDELVEDDRENHDINQNALKQQVKAMFVSKLNHGVLGVDTDQSELARVYALKNATKSIKISQQALYLAPGSPFSHNEKLHPTSTLDGNLIQALAYAMFKNGANVYIVTSNLADDGLIGYSSNVNLDYIYDCLLSTLQLEFHLSSEEGMKELNAHLNLGYLGYFPLMFSKDPFIMKLHRAHNKFWMVDDKIFYFGSHNFYPSAMQEFGLIVESTEAADQLLKNFWNPMWNDVVQTH